MFVNQHKKRVFQLFRGESRSEAIERIQQEARKANKNYHREGRKVLIVTSYEKRLLDDFVKLKELVHREASQPSDFLFSPFQEARSNPEYNSLKNFDRDLGRFLDIAHGFTSTQYRKRLSVICQ